jgi:hypothetical protein
MGEREMTEKERIKFAQKVADDVIEAVDTAWHDGMKIGKEHQKGFQDRIKALEAQLKAVRDYVIDQGSQPRADDGRELLAEKIRDGILALAQEAGE